METQLIKTGKYDSQCVVKVHVFPVFVGFLMSYGRKQILLKAIDNQSIHMTLCATTETIFTLNE